MCEILDASGARAVAEQRHAVGVAAEAGGVLLDPLQHGHLVHQAVVGDLAARQRGRVRVQEPYGESRALGRDSFMTSAKLSGFWTSSPLAAFSKLFTVLINAISPILYAFPLPPPPSQYGRHKSIAH